MASGGRIRDIRIQKELAILAKDPPTGVTCWQDDSLAGLLHSQIVGPIDTPYAGGIFRLELRLPERYPIDSPKVRFLTPIYHPNVDDGGRICLNILKSEWSPSLNIPVVLRSIAQLMIYPNPDDPLVPEIADEFRRNPVVFHHKAKDHTRKNATELPSHEEEGDSSKALDSSVTKSPTPQGPSITVESDVDPGVPEIVTATIRRTTPSPPNILPSADSPIHGTSMKGTDDSCSNEENVGANANDLPSLHKRTVQEDQPISSSGASEGQTLLVTREKTGTMSKNALNHGAPCNDTTLPAEAESTTTKRKVALSGGSTQHARQSSNKENVHSLETATDPFSAFELAGTSKADEAGKDKRPAPEPPTTIQQPKKKFGLSRKFK
ncbi:hypothetical protein M427DRAFT_131207 [Gonapodya prolifera JEL478]|uniref:UBC core domain-containing protein n=1 Tax=Gonapodya prolifera (strain JEL478) TaxID=1344416 RepID=A0A139AUU9_GONPJ|nr:hypothetical protein M427DRAFT_131207 [Gonapodya prolifera JEL478]|eukprot:KXS20353.1 hypothetical protein M427DRAFT_131207 [Gonapodya prolifera JEL478]